MTELFSTKDVSRLLGLHESRLRYWAQTGFVGPTVRRGGRFFYTFRDLIAVKAGKELLDAGVPLQRARASVEHLRETLPEDENPARRLRICSDGDTVVAVDDDVVFEPATGQVVMAFRVEQLSAQIAEVLSLRPDAAPEPITDDAPTVAHSQPSAYQSFLEACRAEERGDHETAAACYGHALDLQPSLAAAHTNLGNILYRRGDLAGARAHYEQALECEPTQVEARYNLGNLLEDIGETEQAIAELRRVCWTEPGFADAHYNLGLMLARVGGVTQARQHLERYLELDPAGEWHDRARAFRDALGRGAYAVTDEPQQASG